MGSPPLDNDCVPIRFTGWKRNGEMLATTAFREPAVECLKKAMPGTAEALKTMAIGEKRRIGGPLVYDIELVALEKP